MESYQATWRGNGLVKKSDADGKLVGLAGKDALLYFSVNVAENTTYRITIEAKKESGNGLMYCNIYGNKNFDFPHASCVCDSQEMQLYDIDVSTKSFPKTVPTILRIWRQPGGTGTIFIKKIIISMMPISESFLDNPSCIEEVRENYINSINNEPVDILDIKQVLPQQIKEAQVDCPKKYLDTGSNIKRVNCRYSAGTESIFKSKTPKKPTQKISQNISLSVVVSIYNRKDFFDRALFWYAKQTLPTTKFEIVVVDDKSSDNIRDLCVKYSKEYGIQFQYILVDKFRVVYEPKSFNQALTNNIGFKKARGSTIVIVGPETMMKENALELSLIAADEGNCVYGKIYRSNNEFTRVITEKDEWKNISFDEMLQMPGARAETGHLTGFWWYYVAVSKEHILNINGVDERYMGGITAEDDNFAFRMDASGVPLIRNNNIIGIHQDHSISDKSSNTHNIRNTKTWETLRYHNVNLLNDWLKTLNPVANKNIDWGTENAIIKLEEF